MIDMARIRERVEGEPIKRLKPGSAILGPEHAGCCGTGLRPMLARSVRGTYLAGYEDPVRRVRDALCCERNARRLLGKRIIHDVQVLSGGRITKERLARPVHQSKGRPAAIRHFRDCCVAVLASNAEIRADMAAKRVAALGGDVGAAVSLGLDY